LLANWTAQPQEVLVVVVTNTRYCVAPPTIPELIVLQNQTHSERRRCCRRQSEVTGE
jgi:hypothetical protein